MKEAATKSTSCSQPNLRSPLSFADKAGRPTLTPGRLTPLFSPSSPLLSTLHLTSVSVVEITSSSTRPSSSKIVLPALRSVAKPA